MTPDFAEIRAIHAKRGYWTPAEIDTVSEALGELLTQFDARQKQVRHQALELLSADTQWHEQDERIADLERQLESARRLALPAFTSPEGDLSEHTHVLDEAFTAAESAAFTAPLEDRPSVCVPVPDELAMAMDRPSAYDMPVGSVVRTADETFLRMTDDPGGWARRSTAKPGTQSGWIEGLFSDGLVTEWRLP